MSPVTKSVKRIEEVDILRGFAICMVILGHAIIKFPVNISAIPWCNWLHYSIYSFHMPLFFIVSGFVYKFKALKPYLVGKSKRILLPYVVFGVFSILLNIFASSLINGSETPKESIIKMLLYGGEYWFLYSLFIIFLLFPLAEKFLKKDIFLVILSVIFIAVQCFIKIPKILTLDSVFYYFPWFTAGCLLRKHMDKLKNLISDKWIITLIISFILSAVFVILSKKLNSEFILLKYLRAVFPIIFLTVLSNKLVKNSEKKPVGIIKKFFEKCSNFSLQFYLFNGYFLTVLRTVLCKTMGIANPVIIITAITIITITGSLIACEILQKIPFIPVICGMNYTGKSRR